MAFRRALQQQWKAVNFDSIMDEKYGLARGKSRWCLIPIA
jgi:hypothetical protein